MNNISEIFKNATPDAVLTFTGAMLTVVISSLLAVLSSYMMTKKSLKVEQKNFEKQIQSELSKIKVQYMFEQKRDSVNYLNQFKLEKLAELYELVGQFGRYNAQLTMQIEKLIRMNKLEEISDEVKGNFKKERTRIEKEFFDKNTMRTITIRMSYFTKIKNKWNQVSSMHNRVVANYPDQILRLVEIKNPEYFDLIIPDEYTINDFLEDLKIVRNGIFEVLDEIENEIGLTMENMEKH